MNVTDRLPLNRVELADISAPSALAHTIHRQLGQLTGAVPVDDIAFALDITQIDRVRFDGCEGVLLTDRRRSYGKILVNIAGGQRRARFSIAHELGHFLLEHHVLHGAAAAFICQSDDMVLWEGQGEHQRQESEANRFAVELLTPRSALGKFLRPSAELDHALALAETFEISREAGIRRYVALQGERLAVVFSRDGRVRYIEKGPGFPPTRVWTGDSLAGLVSPRRSSGPLTSLDPAGAAGWLKWPSGVELFAQTLFQEDGFAATLLVAEPDEDAAADD